MQDFYEILAVIAVGWCLLLAFWLRRYGWKRGLLASTLRVAWLLPLFLAISPRLDKTVVTNSISLKTIHFLEDDSQSMQSYELTALREETRNRLERLCQRHGCRVQHTLLSELSDEVAKGYTPLSHAVQAWMPLTHGEPWILLSDGGDSQPTADWAAQLKNSGVHGGKPLGLILSSPHKEQDNLWIDIVGGPDFGFDQKLIELEATVHRRTANMKEPLTVQVQASVKDSNLASINVTFRPDEESLQVQIPIPPLARGTHLIRISVLPMGSEAAIWDNSVYKSLEVLPNTIGILHLLGSPSWDGRFVRRYLKSEPKYDLISFFILRDPSDVQLTNERELSLIPFPVERLFNEELPNFRAVVLQNFSLYQFLEPGYQKNLVDFVLNGGGLLFIGGPRALHELDIASSPLASLLPFKMKGKGSRAPRQGLSLDPWSEFSSVPFDRNVKFKVRAAEPSKEKRQLATVYDDWLPLDFGLRDEQGFQGLHLLEDVELAEEGLTPLLMAERDDGKTSLLAAASYPGKGRAIWIFSDDLWRLAMNPGAHSSRESYQNFMRSSMTWLLREELQRPLWLQDFSLTTQSFETNWSARLRGPAARFLEEGESWKYRVCGVDVPAQKVTRQMVSQDQWLIGGSINTRMASGVVCEFTLEGQHPAFGTVRASAFGIVPESFADKDMEGSLYRLEQLKELTNGRLTRLGEGSADFEMDQWFADVTGEIGVTRKSEQKLMPDYFWVLDSWWGLLLIALIPLEILVRRWDAFTGHGIREKHPTV